MNLENDWNKIKQIFESASLSSLHFSVASVDSKGYPNITPIGSLILRGNCTGYYFEELPHHLPDNLKGCKHVALLALNSNPSIGQTLCPAENLKPIPAFA